MHTAMDEHTGIFCFSNQNIFLCLIYFEAIRLTSPRTRRRSIKAGLHTTEEDDKTLFWCFPHLIFSDQLNPTWPIKASTQPHAPPSPPLSKRDTAPCRTPSPSPSALIWASVVLLFFFLSKDRSVCVYICLDTKQSWEVVQREDVTVTVMPVYAHFVCTCLCFRKQWLKRHLKDMASC